MAKKNIFLIILICLLLLIVLAGYFYWQEKIFKPSPSPEQLSLREEIKKIVCEDKQKVLDIADSKNILNQDFFIGKELEPLRDYYFCQGLLNDDSENACDKKLYLKESEVNECKSSFFFLSMLTASLRGERERAREICVNNANGGIICDYIDNLASIAEKDICSQLPQESQKMCYVIFAGKEEYCQDLDSEKQKKCLATADFLKILRVGEKDKCNSLAFAGLVGREGISCKLYFDNFQQTCDAIYSEFNESFCGVN
ncbi:hypothetical protein KJ853_04665 [Patescibacteria group bacterium]|nr:hypothetical protein [Patescibacteria group bacterium]